MYIHNTTDLVRVLFQYGASSHAGNRTFRQSTYRKTSSISRTKSQNLNVSCILLQLSSLNPLKTGVKLRMKM